MLTTPCTEVALVDAQRIVSGCPTTTSGADSVTLRVGAGTFNVTVSCRVVVAVALFALVTLSVT